MPADPIDSRQKTIDWSLFSWTKEFWHQNVQWSRKFRINPLGFDYPTHFWNWDVGNTKKSRITFKRHHIFFLN